MQEARAEADHPVGGGCKEAGGRHPHGDQVKQHRGCEVGGGAVHPASTLPTASRTKLVAGALQSAQQQHLHGDQVNSTAAVK